MATSNESSAQYTAQTTYNSMLQSPDHGRVKCLTFEHTQVNAGDATSVQSLIKLPAGRIRVLTNISKFRNSAFGAARTLDVGYAAYTNLAGTAVVADPDFFSSAVDVSSAALTLMDESTTPDLSHALDSTTGIVVNSTVSGGTIPAAATIKGYVLYVIA